MIPVLVVDDVPANLIAMKKLLRRLPVEADCVESANEGLVRLLERDYALALIDVNMPGMNGIEMAELMHSSPETAQVPIIFVTAESGDLECLRRSYGAGAVDYITKPYEPEFLISKVRVFAELYQARQDLQAALLGEQQANEELSRFAAIASHDLRSPLAKTQRMLGLIRKKYGDQLSDTALIEKLDRMEGILGEMGNLVSALYGLYQASNGDIEREPLQLDDVVAAACELLADDIQASSAQVCYRQLPAVTGNADLLRQAFQNLISNSIKYAREGIPPRIEIASVAPAPTEKNQVVLEIRDNGMGFDVAAGTDIFSPFTRLDHTREVEGLGIGLATTRKIIRTHGGEISATGRHGEGATFTIRLPAAE